MSWPPNRQRWKPCDIRPQVTPDDRRLIAEAIAAGRVTVCPTAAAPEISTMTICRRDASLIAADILRVERAG